MSVPRLHLELPSNTPAELRVIELLNDRFRQIQEAVDAPTWISDVDAGGFRLVNLGDPTAARDAINLQYADKRYLRGGSGGTVDLSGLRAVDAALAARIAVLEARITALTGGGGGGTGLAAVLDNALTTTTTNITSPFMPADGDLLFVRNKQDATGGRRITWATTFKGVGPSHNDPTALAACHFLFCGLGGNWLLAAEPKLGVL